MLAVSDGRVLGRQTQILLLASGNGHKLKPSKFRLNTAKHFFFSVKGVEHWSRLSREVVESLCLEILNSLQELSLGQYLVSGGGQ